MNYELAKKLKEAGLKWDEVNQLDSVRRETYPTLSELIEACGEKGFMLVHTAHEWLAIKSKVKYINRSRIEFETEKVGESPEEAVASLWLKLNKK